MKIAVLGAGAWGTALALTLASRHQVRLWTWQAAHAQAMNAARENAEFLPNYKLPPDIVISADIAAVAADADLALVATPMAGLRDTVKALRSGLPFLWVCKGLETGAGLLPHQVVEQLAINADCGALTGPSFAEEVAKGLPTAVTLASRNLGFARDMAER
ncbi:MAG: glycerol-3-phosphate dehydrogenase, partial [Zoogloeaceae bacterium]|nr:glycerol-3-phosphate dehydrogenase [Zoogloeaceae bacterium]